MLKLGNTIRYLRELNGQTQIDAAERLGITNVHLSKLEHDKAYPSPDLLNRAAEVWGVDLYVLNWCLHGDPAKLPSGVRDAAIKLTAALKADMAAKGVIQRGVEDAGNQKPATAGGGDRTAIQEARKRG